MFGPLEALLFTHQFFSDFSKSIVHLRKLCMIGLCLATKLEKITNLDHNTNTLSPNQKCMNMYFQMYLHFEQLFPN